MKKLVYFNTFLVAGTESEIVYSTGDSVGIFTERKSKQKDRHKEDSLFSCGVSSFEYEKKKKENSEHMKRGKKKNKSIT